MTISFRTVVVPLALASFLVATTGLTSARAADLFSEVDDLVKAGSFDAALGKLDKAKADTDKALDKNKSEKKELISDLDGVDTEDELKAIKARSDANIKQFGELSAQAKKVADKRAEVQDGKEYAPAVTANTAESYGDFIKKYPKNRNRNGR